MNSQRSQFAPPSKSGHDSYGYMPMPCSLLHVPIELQKRFLRLRQSNRGSNVVQSHQPQAELPQQMTPKMARAYYFSPKPLRRVPSKERLPIHMFIINNHHHHHRRHRHRHHHRHHQLQQQHIYNINIKYLQLYIGMCADLHGWVTSRHNIISSLSILNILLNYGRNPSHVWLIFGKTLCCVSPAFLSGHTSSYPGWHLI